LSSAHLHFAMSSREPLWYCHQCGAEMRPLMAPHPICASCRGEFVEKMENAANDPREFAYGDDGDLDVRSGLDALLTALQGVSERTNRSGSRQRPEGDGGSRVTFQILDEDGRRTISIGGPNTLGRRSAQGSDGRARIPTMSEYIRRGTSTNTTIAGPLMAHYIMAMLGHNDPVSEMFSNMGGEGGRMGDYVFNQEALDQIITQLMENSNANRPVPATEEIIDNLKRDVLLEESDTLEKDCAICKEQFSIKTEDPDELMVVTLPCQHIFHEPCITPWLKSSGTCPVCRHSLVPQPGDQPTSRSNGTARPGSPQSNSHSRSRPPEASPQPGLIQAILNGFGRTSESSSHRRSNSDPPRSANRGSRSRFPGSWEEGLD